MLAWELINEDIDIDKGLEYAQKSLDIDPNQEPDRVHKILVHGYSKKERYIEVVELLYNLGKMYLKQNKYKEILNFYQDVIKAYPELEKTIISSEYAEAHYILGEIYYNRREYSEAVREYEQAIQYGYVFVGQERTDDVWLKSGYASEAVMEVMTESNMSDMDVQIEKLKNGGD